MFSVTQVFICGNICTCITQSIMHHLRCHSWWYNYSICNVNSASFGQFNPLETDIVPLFHVPLRQCQMTVMTSGIASQSSVQQFVQTDKNKHQRSALLSLCGKNLPETGGFPTKRDSNTANFSICWRHNVQVTSLHSPRDQVLRCSYPYRK